MKVFVAFSLHDDEPLMPHFPTGLTQDWDWGEGPSARLGGGEGRGEEEVEGRRGKKKQNVNF